MKIAKSFALGLTCVLAAASAQAQGQPKQFVSVLTVHCKPEGAVDYEAYVKKVIGAGDKLANGAYLGVCGGAYSFADFVATLNAQGHTLEVLQVPPEAYDSFYPGAHEMREMFQYFAEKTYFGPDHEKAIAAANALVPGGYTKFADWAKTNLKPS